MPEACCPVRRMRKTAGGRGGRGEERPITDLAAGRYWPPRVAVGWPIHPQFRCGLKVAEREGFEPSVPCDTPDFESGTIDHSATSPGASAGSWAMLRQNESRKFSGVQEAVRGRGQDRDARGSFDPRRRRQPPAIRNSNLRSGAASAPSGTGSGLPASGGAVGDQGSAT